MKLVEMAGGCKFGFHPTRDLQGNGEQRGVEGGRKIGSEKNPPQSGMGGTGGL